MGEPERTAKPWLRGRDLDFDRFFREAVEPRIAATGPLRARVEGRIRLGRRVTVAGAGAAVLFILAGEVLESDSSLGWLEIGARRWVETPDLGWVDAALVIAGIACVGGVLVTRFLVGPVEQELHRALSGAILRPLADLFDLRHDYPGGFPRLGQFAGLLPDYNRSRIDDRLRGEVDGLRLEVHEVRLSVVRRLRGRRSRRATTTFHGLVASLDPVPAVDGRIVLKPKRVLVGRLLDDVVTRGDRVDFGMEDPAFEDCYTVYATDASTARACLSPALRSTLVRAHALMAARDTYALFSGETLRLSFDLRREFARIDDVLDTEGMRTLTRALLEEMVVIGELIEVLRPALRMDAETPPATRP